MKQPEPAAVNLFTSREFRATLVLGGIGLLLSYTFLTFLAHSTDALMIDMRQWQVTFEGSDAAPPIPPRKLKEFLRKLQPSIPAQQPFRITLQLPRVPTHGDRLVAHHNFQVTGDNYCFDVLAFSDYYLPDSTRAVETFAVRVRLQEEVVAEFPIADRRGEWLHFDNIRPKGGEVNVQVELAANASRVRPFWQGASTIQFEYGRLYSCPT